MLRSEASLPFCFLLLYVVPGSVPYQREQLQLDFSKLSPFGQGIYCRIFTELLRFAEFQRNAEAVCCLDSETPAFWSFSLDSFAHGRIFQNILPSKHEISLKIEGTFSDSFAKTVAFLGRSDHPGFACDSAVNRNFNRNLRSIYLHDRTVAAVTPPSPPAPG